MLYDRVPAAQKVTWHRRIGERLETAYGKRAKEIALDLAVHFERGHDYQRATRYLQHAAENALRKNAHQEALTLLTKGLELLKILPATPTRSLQELRLLRPLGLALIAIKGYAAPEVEQTYARAYELCQQDGRPQLLLEAMLGLQAFYFARGEIRKTREVAEQRLRLAQCVSMSMPTALIGAHAGLGEPLLSLGELTAAREHFAQAWGLYNPQEHNINVIQGWVDPGVVVLSLMAATLWSLGYPDQAQQRLNEGLALAEGLSHPFSLAFTLTYACSLHSVRQEWQLRPPHLAPFHLPFFLW
ncbi:MAG: hypothetical protein HY268_17465 [Deltaproteobacteria bacterium]|nr:hypothetical protein [Deltaproteobacteria bacterium]